MEKQCPIKNKNITQYSLILKVLKRRKKNRGIPSGSGVKLDLTPSRRKKKRRKKKRRKKKQDGEKVGLHPERFPREERRKS